MGRNMFGPIRGSSDDDEWKGWWGDDPPYHHPVFVLTQHARESVTMQGGTTFHFVTDGVEAALAQAFEAAGGADVRIGGGASVIQQYLRAGLVDEMHVAIVPILIGGASGCSTISTARRTATSVSSWSSRPTSRMRASRAARRAALRTLAPSGAEPGAGNDRPRNSGTGGPNGCGMPHHAGALAPMVSFPPRRGTTPS
jgi:dihydrofolate reductase